MGDEKMQKIAIRNQEIFARYADRFDDATITAPPYNFTLVPIDDDVDPDTVRIEDFTVTPDGTVWDRARYDQRVAQKTKQDKLARYHACIQQKIRSHSVCTTPIVSNANALRAGCFRRSKSA